MKNIYNLFLAVVMIAFVGTLTASDSADCGKQTKTSIVEAPVAETVISNIQTPFLMKNIVVIGAYNSGKTSAQEIRLQHNEIELLSLQETKPLIIKNTFLTDSNLLSRTNFLDSNKRKTKGKSKRYSTNKFYCHIS